MSQSVSHLKSLFEPKLGSIAQPRMSDQKLQETRDTGIPLDEQLQFLDDVTLKLRILEHFVAPDGNSIFQQVLHLTENRKLQLEKEQSGSHLPEAASLPTEINEALSSTPQLTSNLDEQTLSPDAEGITELGRDIDNSRNADSVSEFVQTRPQKSDKVSQKEPHQNVVSSVSSQPNDFALKENSGETSSPQSCDSRNDESGSIYNKRSVLELWKLSDDSSHHEAVVDLMRSRSFNLHISSLKKSDISDEIIISTTDLDNPEQCESFSLCEIDYSDKKACYLFTESLNSLIKFCCYGRVNNITFEYTTVRPEFFSNYKASIHSSYIDKTVLPVKMSSPMELFVDKMDGSALECVGLLTAVTPRHLELVISLTEASQCDVVLKTRGAVSTKSISVDCDTDLQKSANIDDCIFKLSASSIIVRPTSLWFLSDTKKVYPIGLTVTGLSKFIEQWLTGERVIDKAHFHQSNFCNLRDKPGVDHRVEFARLLYAQVRQLGATNKIVIESMLGNDARQRLNSLDAERRKSRILDFVFDSSSSILIVGKADGKELAVVVRRLSTPHKYDSQQVAIDMFPLD